MIRRYEVRRQLIRDRQRDTGRRGPESGTGLRTLILTNHSLWLFCTMIERRLSRMGLSERMKTTLSKVAEPVAFDVVEQGYYSAGVVLRVR